MNSILRKHMQSSDVFCNGSIMFHRCLRRVSIRGTERLRKRHKATQSNCRKPKTSFESSRPLCQGFGSAHSEEVLIFKPDAAKPSNLNPSTLGREERGKVFEFQSVW